jgi:SAM-dependent methyltransferase
MVRTLRHDADAIQSFFDGWHVYRRIIAHNYMFHAEIHSAMRMWLDRHPSNRSLLDLGCGDSSVMARTLSDSGFRKYVGVDLSPVALDMAREALETTGVSATFRLADYMDHLQVASSGSADVIVAGYTVHHLLGEARNAFFRECRRVLSPGGGLLLYDVFLSGHETRDEYMVRNHGWRRATWSNMSETDFDAIWKHVSAADYPQTIDAMALQAHRAGFKAPTSLFEAPTGIHRLYAFT